MKRLSVLLVSMLFCIGLSGCSENRFLNDNEIKQFEGKITGTITFSYLDGDEQLREFANNFELEYAKAPITVTNFVKLAKDGFYNGTYCLGYSTTDGGEYLNADVMVYNDSDPKQLVQKELDYYIKGEYSENGWNKNDIKHNATGVMSMIRGEGADTAGAAFMICLNDEGFSERDGNYAAFGKITIDGTFLSNFRNFSGSMENKEFKIKSITINTLPAELGEPIKIKK